MDSSQKKSGKEGGRRKKLEVILTGMVKRKDFVKGVANFLTHFLSFLKQFFLSVSDLHFTFFFFVIIIIIFIFPAGFSLRTRLGNTALVQHLQMMAWPPLPRCLNGAGGVTILLL